MLEKLKMARDMGLTTGILLTDYELLIAKLNAYGFSKNALDLVYDYLSERKQRTKIIESFSTWFDIVFGGFYFRPSLI